MRRWGIWQQCCKESCADIPHRPREALGTVHFISNFLERHHASKVEPCAPRLTSLRTLIRIVEGRPALKTSNLAGSFLVSREDIINRPAMGARIRRGGSAHRFNPHWFYQRFHGVLRQVGVDTSALGTVTSFSIIPPARITLGLPKSPYVAIEVFDSRLVDKDLARVRCSQSRESGKPGSFSDVT